MSKVVYKFKIAITGLNDCMVFETKTDQFSNNNLVFNVYFKSVGGYDTFYSFSKYYTVEELLDKNGLLECEVEYDLSKGDYGIIEYSLATYYNCVNSSDREFIKHTENFSFKNVEFEHADVKLSYLTAFLVDSNEDLKGGYNPNVQDNYNKNNSIVVDSSAGYNNTKGRFISIFHLRPNPYSISDSGELYYLKNYTSSIVLVAEDLETENQYVISNEIPLVYKEYSVHGREEKVLGYEGYIDYSLDSYPDLNNKLLKIYTRFLISGETILNENYTRIIDFKDRYVSGEVVSQQGNEFVTFFNSSLGSENVQHTIIINNTNGKDGITVNRNSNDRLTINRLEISGVPLINDKCDCNQSCNEYFTYNSGSSALEMRYEVKITRTINSETNEENVVYNSSNESFFPYFTCEGKFLEEAINNDLNQLQMSGRINDTQKVKYKVSWNLTNHSTVPYQKNVFGNPNNFEAEININLTD